jgi:hypothetical protein
MRRGWRKARISEATHLHQRLKGTPVVGPKTNDMLRWEWRTFSPSLADLEAKIGLAVQIAPRQSDEIYLLNSATPHSAKIRGAVLEVKRLVQVDPSGLRAAAKWFAGRLCAASLSCGMLSLRRKKQQRTQPRVWYLPLRARARYQRNARSPKLSPALEQPIRRRMHASNIGRRSLYDAGGTRRL